MNINKRNKQPNSNISYWGESMFRKLYNENSLDEFIVENIDDILDQTLWAYSKGQTIISISLCKSKRKLENYLFSVLNFDREELPKTDVYLTLGGLVT